MPAAAAAVVAGWVAVAWLGAALPAPWAGVARALALAPGVPWVAAAVGLVVASAARLVTGAETAFAWALAVSTDGARRAVAAVTPLVADEPPATTKAPIAAASSSATNPPASE